MTAGLALLAATACAPRDRQPERPPDVEFVPSEVEVVDTMLALAGVGPRDVVYDLGSGDGRILIAAAKRFGVRGVGIDIDPVRVAESRRNADTAGVGDLVEFREGDLFATDLGGATVVTVYLLADLNLRLRPKLLAELRPGARVVSHEFDMGDWPPDSATPALYTTVYLWTIPAPVAGEWSASVTVDSTRRQYRLTLDQRYQQITGVARLAETTNGRPVRIAPTRMRGDSIELRLESPDRLTLVGRASGDTLLGVVRRGDAAVVGTWRATRER